MPKPSASDELLLGPFAVFAGSLGVRKGSGFDTETHLHGCFGLGFHDWSIHNGLGQASGQFSEAFRFSGAKLESKEKENALTAIFAPEMRR